MTKLTAVLLICCALVYGRLAAGCGYFDWTPAWRTAGNGLALVGAVLLVSLWADAFRKGTA